MKIAKVVPIMKNVSNMSIKTRGYIPLLYILEYYTLNTSGEISKNIKKVLTFLEKYVRINHTKKGDNTMRLTEIQREFLKLVKAFDNFAEKWADYEPIIEVQIYHREVTKRTEHYIEAGIDADDFGVSLTLLYDEDKYDDNYDE